jgi:hypothetical protein
MWQALLWLKEQQWPEEAQEPRLRVEELQAAVSWWPQTSLPFHWLIPVLNPRWVEGGVEPTVF